MKNTIFNTTCRAVLVGALLLVPVTLKADPPIATYSSDVEHGSMLQSWNNIEVDGQPTDPVAGMFARQEGIYTAVFQEPFVSESDGVLELLEEPAAGILTYCLRGEEACAFYVERYDDYNFSGLLWLAQEAPEDVIASLLDLEERFTLGWATGWLISEHGEAAISGFTVGIKQDGGDTAYIMLPLDPSDRAWFLPSALTWAVSGEPELGGILMTPLFADYDVFYDDAGQCADCDDLYDEDECAEYASCVCGNEPICNVRILFTGIQECMRAAGCRVAKCHWAHCMTTHEMSCEHWYAIGVTQSYNVCHSLSHRNHEVHAQIPI